MLDKGQDPAQQIKAGYKRLLVREMPEGKVKIFSDLYQQALERYEKDAEASKKITASGEASPQLAAMTVVANAMLNLDEVMMKE
jgi:hypothetical protein